MIGKGFVSKIGCHFGGRKLESFIIVCIHFYTATSMYVIPHMFALSSSLASSLSKKLQYLLVCLCVCVCVCVLSSRNTG